jgi:glycosyltransferase involved in cell wall biosynthesis
MGGMKICMGVLAYNEEKGIEATLGDIVQQDLFGVSGHEVALLVVVNGSKDRTAELARGKLENSGLTWQVIEVARPGKGNAWNRLIYEFSDADTDVFLLADADIRLPQPEALRKIYLPEPRRSPAVFTNMRSGY